MGIEYGRIELRIDGVSTFDEQAGLVPAGHGFVHGRHRRHHLAFHQTHDRGLFGRFGLAQGAVDDLAGHIAIAFRAITQDFLGHIDIGRAVSDHHLGMFQRILDFR